jgi:1-acyl-sn-glycerol-3-phosphate acyltransferase
MSQESPYGRPRSRLSILCRVILAFTTIGVLTVAVIPLCLVVLPWRLARIRVGNVYGKLVGATVFRLAGIIPQIEGRNLDELGPALIVANHTSTIDMWVGMWLNPAMSCGVAKREILKIPFFGFIFWLSGHLLVDRSNREAAIHSMAQLGDFVRSSRLGVWMWPEGSRSRNGRLKPLKKGFVHLAIATGLPVVPIVAHDADLMWPSHSFEIRPGPMRMVVLDPIDTSTWTPETSDEHILEVWSALNAALTPRQRGETGALESK